MQTISNRASGSIYLLLMFVATVISLWLTVDLSLTFHVQQPLFLTGLDNLGKSVWAPGGLTNYLASFITTMFYFPIPGSIILALLLSIIPILVFNNCQKKNTFLIAISLSSIIWLLELLLYNNYNFKVENQIVLTGSMLIGAGMVRIYKKGLSPKIVPVLQVVLLLLTYLFLGGPGLILTSIIFIIRLLFLDLDNKLKFPTVIITAIIALVFPLLAARKVFILVPLKESYLGSFANSEHYVNPELLYVAVAVLIFIEIIALFNIKKLEVKSVWTNHLISGIFIVLIFVLPVVTQNKVEKCDIKVDYYASLGKWEKVLQTAGKEQQDNYIVAFEVNRALHYTGSLMENVFNVKQIFGAGALFVESNINYQILVPTSDMYYDLGFINESRHWAHEAYTRLGQQPRILKRLVQVNIILGKYNTAEKYILLLKKTLLFKNWALEQEKFLFNESAVANNMEYNSKRVLLPATDFFSNKNKPAANMYNLINQPALNPMAFDYMMTDLLLEHELIYIVRNVSLFHDFGYKNLPRPIQEAVILYMMKTQQPRIDLGGYKLSQETVTRFNEYTKLYSLYKNNDAKSKEELDKKYANSFWYYIHFISPLRKKSSEN